MLDKCVSLKAKIDAVSLEARSLSSSNRGRQEEARRQDPNELLRMAASKGSSKKSKKDGAKKDGGKTGGFKKSED